MALVQLHWVCLKGGNGGVILCGELLILFPDAYYITGIVACFVRVRRLRAKSSRVVDTGAIGMELLLNNDACIGVYYSITFLLLFCDIDLRNCH